MVKLHTCLELVDHGPLDFSAAFPLPLSLSPYHASPSGLPIIKMYTNNNTVTCGHDLYIYKNGCGLFVHPFLGW